MSVQLRVILCSSLKMLSLRDIDATHLIPVSEQQKPHDHRDLVLPSELLYDEVGIDFEGAV